MNNNLELYNNLREVPEEAKSKIEGGRMNGKTNINAMWRIKKLTKTFGIVGIGWKTKTIRKWIEEGADGEKCAFVDIELYIKVDGEWSEPIEGSGGSSLVEKNRKGLYTSDECFKMAYTDALSVACKALGIGADVYFSEDRNKYDKNRNLDLDNNEVKELKKEIEVLKDRNKFIADEYKKLVEKIKQHKNKNYADEEVAVDLINEKQRKYLLKVASSEYLNSTGKKVDSYNVLKKIIKKKYNITSTKNIQSKYFNELENELQEYIKNLEKQQREEDLSKQNLIENDKRIEEAEKNQNEEIEDKKITVIKGKILYNIADSWKDGNKCLKDIIINLIKLEELNSVNPFDLPEKYYDFVKGSLEEAKKKYMSRDK